MLAYENASDAHHYLNPKLHSLMRTNPYPIIHHSNSTRFLAAACCLARSALLLFLLLSNALSVPVPASPGEPYALSLIGGAVGGLAPCPDCGDIECCGTGGAAGRFKSDSRRCDAPALLDIAGGGGMFVMGCRFESRMGALRL